MPTITSVVVCDEIRREITNKDIIIGAYSGDIIVSAFPSTIPIAFWIDILFDAAGEETVQFRFNVTGKDYASFSLKAKAGAPGSLAIPITGVLITVEGETILTLEHLSGQKWSVLKQKKIVKGVVASIAPSPLPQGDASSNS